MLSNYVGFFLEPETFKNPPKIKDHACNMSASYGRDYGREFRYACEKKADKQNTYKFEYVVPSDDLGVNFKDIRDVPT